MTQTQQLTERQRQRLVHCLRVAATQFDQDALTFTAALPERSTLVVEFRQYAGRVEDWLRGHNTAEISNLIGRLVKQLTEQKEEAR